MSRLTCRWLCLVGSLVMSSSSAVQAYQLSLLPSSPQQVPSFGDIIEYEVFLDTEGRSSIEFFSVSLTFDPSLVQYRPDVSAANSYYPLYAPASGKTPILSWLLPQPFDGNPCSESEPLCANPPQLWTGSPPPIGGQVNVDFLAYGSTSTIMTATNLLLARLSFEVVGNGLAEWSFGFGNGGNEFTVDGIDISDPSYSGPLSVTANGGASIWVPEPSTALLLAVGLAGLAYTRRIGGDGGWEGADCPAGGASARREDPK